MHRRATNAVSVLGIVALGVLATPVPANADEVRDDQWYMGALDINEAHKLAQGEGITIGLVDGGVDATHPDLKKNIKAGKDFGDSSGKGLEDVDGHGTSMAGLLVGHGHGKDDAEGVMGVAPKAKVLSAGVHCEDACDGGSLISDAIIWLVDQGVDIISISMSSADDNNKALDYATRKGIPVVASAGNSTPEYDDILGKIDPPKWTSWPASAVGSVPVTGTTEAGKFWDGSQTLNDAATQPQLGLSAPAKDIVTVEKGGGYATHSGTSGSAPLVAGTLALIKSAYPDLSYNQWIDRLLDTVDDKGSKGFDDKYGWGIVNPHRALTEETTYEGKDGAQVSSPDDRLPLDEQGKGQGQQDNGNGSGNSDGALTPSGASSLLLPLCITAAVLVLAAAVVIAVVVAKRRAKTRGGSPQPPGAV